MNTAQAIQSSPATAAGFELENLDNDTVNEITHDVVFTETLDGEPITGFKIVGKNSAQYQQATNEIRIANIRRSAKRSKQIDTSTEEGAALLAKTVADNERVQANAVVVGWFGFNSEGAPIAFNKQYVDRLFTKYPTWLAKVTAALDNDANFTKV